MGFEVGRNDFRRYYLRDGLRSDDASKTLPKSLFFFWRMREWYLLSENDSRRWKKGMSEISIKTQRLCLRPLRETDLAAFATYRSDLEVARYQSWDAPYSLDQAKLFLIEMKSAPAGVPGHWYQLGVERDAESGIIGDVAFQVLEEDVLQAHIGVTFSRQHQKQGYASEAVTGLLGYLFGELNLHRVSAICDANNGASARLLERVGMRREGHFIENIWFKGAWGSEFLYAILYDEWKRKQEDNKSDGSGILAAGSGE